MGTSVVSKRAAPILALCLAGGAFILCAPVAATAQSSIELRQGLVITKSARVTPRTYRLRAADSSDSAAVITIRGDNITVDFAGATMVGTTEDALPDAAKGIAIRIDGGRNVRLINAHIRGYKIGILAQGVSGLSLIDNELSYNWKPRLYSIVEHESLIDWLSFHHNEKGEWLRYGAGAYLSDVAAGEITGNIVNQGMNGLMLVRSNGLRIWNNNFSFNSGVGIGLYRSSGNTVMHNHIGIAIEHGQNNLIMANIFAADSTDIRIWADSIEPSNWGYPKHRDTRSTSYKIEGNLFGDAKIGVRASNTSGLSLTDNRLIDVDSPTVLRDTTGYSYTGNTTERDTPWPRRFLRPPSELVGTIPEPIKNGFIPSRPDTSVAGRPRSAIIVDEWGPYDYRSPKLWPVDSIHALPLRVRTLGPAGKWRVASRRGVASPSADSGAIGDTISVTRKPDSLGDWELALDYTGESTVSPRGERRSAGLPYRFSYGRFEPKNDWTT